MSPGETLLYNDLDEAGKVRFLEILKGREEERDEAIDEARKEERKRGVCLPYIYYRDFTMLCMLC